MHKIALIGLGYVGMPLAAALAARFEVVGFDVNKERIEELKSGTDRTMELDSSQMQAAIKNGLKFSCDLADITDCNFYIVTVPTPIDGANHPDLSPLYKASQSIAKVLKKGDIVVYESTVYPGVTEDECVPVLEQSGLKMGPDFSVGYSPERINPGDKEHTVTKIKKIISANDAAALKRVKEVYGAVIEAGLYEASSIKVAEAAKVIENTQRDINIAFVNELQMIFERLGIDTNEVLDAAGSKWNFLKFRPGLVGGHCIGVDPYYLTHKAQSVGQYPEMILAARRINNAMASFHASTIIKRLIKNGVRIKGAKIAILGITFKENCPDIRNSKVPVLVKELNEYGCEVSVFDPWASENEVKKEYKIDLQSMPNGGFKDYACVVMAVGHSEFSGVDFGGAMAYYIKRV